MNMQSIDKLANTIFSTFSRYAFTTGDDFCWSASQQAITHPPLLQLEDIWSLLHEIAHAELGHADYRLDIQLLKLEAAAWDYAAATLAPRCGTFINDGYAQDHLDTYRIWLHKRSRCPQCGQNAMQTNTKTYSCINCRFLWRANEARLCRLRRIRLPDQNHSF